MDDKFDEIDNNLTKILEVIEDLEIRIKQLEDLND